MTLEPTIPLAFLLYSHLSKVLETPDGGWGMPHTLPTGSVLPKMTEEK